MPPVVIVLIVAVVVFAVAAGAIGRESHRLDAIAPRVVYIDSQAVDYVAACLPPAVQERVTPEELWDLLCGHLNWMHAKGLMPRVAVDQRQDLTDRPVVIEDTTAVGYLIGLAEHAGIAVDDVAIVAVVEGHLRYLGEIGAIGPEADDPEAMRPQLGSALAYGELPPATP
jgi:hypothetical protein